VRGRSPGRFGGVNKTKKKKKKKKGGGGGGGGDNERLLLKRRLPGVSNLVQFQVITLIPSLLRLFFASN